MSSGHPGQLVVHTADLAAALGGALETSPPATKVPDLVARFAVAEDVPGR